LDLESPGRRDYYVALEHDSIWGDHLIPLTVMVGPQARRGEGLVAFGSNHGNEYEGPVAIRHLMRDIDPAEVRGRVILVPVLNVAAFRAGTRDSSLDDGVNLNRAFIEGAGVMPALSGITHRIAAFVRAFIWPHAHVVIDLHAGGTVARFALATSFHPIDDPVQGKLIEETARWFGTPLVIAYQNETPGLLPSEAERRGKITVGGEFGWGGAIQKDGVRYARHGVVAAAIHHEQLNGRIEKIAHHADGTQRTTVGLLHDFERLDLEPWPVRAGVKGVVIAQAWSAPVVQGQHILCVGRIMPLAELNQLAEDLTPTTTSPHLEGSRYAARPFTSRDSAK
jgi:predicted deacylase